MPQLMTVTATPPPTEIYALSQAPGKARGCSASRGTVARQRRARGQNRIMSREPHSSLRGELVIVIDCSQVDRSAEFWTGTRDYARDSTATGRYQSLLSAEGTGAEILLRQVRTVSAARGGEG